MTQVLTHYEATIYKLSQCKREFIFGYLLGLSLKWWRHRGDQQFQAWLHTISSYFKIFFQFNVWPVLNVGARLLLASRWLHRKKLQRKKGYRFRYHRKPGKIESSWIIRAASRGRSLSDTNYQALLSHIFCDNQLHSVKASIPIQLEFLYPPIDLITMNWIITDDWPCVQGRWAVSWEITQRE